MKQKFLPAVRSILFSAALLPCGALFSQHSPVFPEPSSITYTTGEFVVPSELTFAYPPDSKWSGIAVPQQEFGQNGIRLRGVTEDSGPVLKFSYDAHLGEEEYRLVVMPGKLEILANSQNAAFYAWQTLSQLLRDKKPGETLRCLRLTDEPAYAYRGVHLDCARHFFTIPEIKGFIDEIARLKFNRFHWHLTDDQGWRIEIRKYPKLTELGAWRDSTLIGHFSSNPQVYGKKRYGGFYTQQQAREIVEYAANRGITVVPEIEMPGHARAALHAYPELGCTGEQLPVEGLWGVFDDIFCAKAETRQFLKDVLDEVMEIFPSQVIHIGGDEAPKVRWDVCSHCAKVKAENGIRNSHELQSFFIQDIENHLLARGRTIIGWDEILEGGLAQNAQVMSWRGEEGGIAAANLGHDVVMTPTAFCYFDYYQSGDPGEPLAIGGFLPLEKVYAFNPVPAAIAPEKRHHILGAQANLWTEYLPEMKDVQYSAFPRLIAMSEVLWTGRTISYPDFVSAMTTNYLPALEARGVRFSRSFLYPELRLKAADNGISYFVEFPLSQPGQADEIVTVPRTGEPQTVKQEVTIAHDAAGNPVSRTYSFTSHAILGIPVTFITPPDAKYDHHGELALTDGVTGARPWKGDQWLGFSNDTVQFSIDLGKLQKVKKLQLGTLNDPGSWIYSPKKIIVELSRDGKKYKSLPATQITSGLTDLKISSKTWFMRITLVNDEFIPAGNSGAGNTPWTFIDELILKL